MADYKGIEYLRRKLAGKRPRVALRYRYYEMKNAMQAYTPMIPPEMRRLNEVLGWCGKAVDTLADRLVFRDFASDSFDLMGIYRMNNADILFDSAVLSALISACCFIYISPDEDGFPRMQVIDGGSATGEMDPITGMLREGYAVIKNNEFGRPVDEVYLTAGTVTLYHNGKAAEEWTNAAPYPLLAPILYRPDPVRPFGHSRISRACMQIMQGALRTVLRSEVSAEFYSFPQKYVTGLSPDAEEMDRWKAAMSSMIAFTKDDEGDSPKLGQFTQQSMSPYTEQLRTFAALFAGETGLTLDDLGFVTDNPSSADAIKASHESLRLLARKAQRTFGPGFLNAGYLAACVRDDVPYRREQLYLSAPRWEPVFEPDAAMLGLIGDGAVKINQAVPGYFGAGNLRALTGVRSDGE